MEADVIVRKQIEEKVQKDLGRKVRCVFYLCTTKDDKIAYGISGNNNHIFGIAMVDNVGAIKIIT